MILFLLPLLFSFLYWILFVCFLKNFKIWCWHRGESWGLFLCSVPSGPLHWDDPWTPPCWKQNYISPLHFDTTSHPNSRFKDHLGNWTISLLEISYIYPCFCIFASTALGEGELTFDKIPAASWPKSSGQLHESSTSMVPNLPHTRD